MSKFPPSYPLYTQTPLSQLSVAVPFGLGQLILTKDGHLALDTPDGRIFYSSVIFVSSLSALESLEIKSESKLYAVDSNLYRWDGSSFIPIGGEGTFFVEAEYDDELDEWNLIAKKYDANGNVTVEVLVLKAVIGKPGLINDGFYGNSIVVVPTLIDLETMDKSGSQFYCVKDTLYRWADPELVQVGISDHTRLMNRNASGQHPAAAIQCVDGKSVQAYINEIVGRDVIDRQSDIQSRPSDYSCRVLRDVAALDLPTASPTGVIKISIPANWDIPYFYDFELRGELSNNDGPVVGPWALRVGGSSHPNAFGAGNRGWINCSGSSGDPLPFQVRFGYDGTKLCVLLGNASSVWRFSSVSVHKATLYNCPDSATIGSSNWEIELIPDDTGITDIVDVPVLNVQTALVNTMPRMNTSAGTTVAKDLAVANLSSGNGTHIGTLKITVPFGWSDSLLSLEVFGFAIFANWTAHVSGNPKSSGWGYAQARRSTNAPFDQVRLGYDGTNLCILLGQTTTAWGDGVVLLQQVIDRNRGSLPTTGWVIETITDETGITQILDVPVQSAATVAKETVKSGAPQKITLRDATSPGSAYRRSVIALCEVTNDNIELESWSLGSLVLHRKNGIYKPILADVAFAKVYNTVNVYARLTPSLTGPKPWMFTDTGIKPCTFAYGGKQYGGVEVFINAAQLTDVYFYGITNFNAFLVDYYDTQNKVNINPEIAGSLDFEDTVVFAPSTDIGAAPGTSFLLPSGTDLNDVITPGYYHCPTTALCLTLLNNPVMQDFTSGVGFVMVVYDQGNQRVQQHVYPSQWAASPANTVYCRTTSNGALDPPTWQAWGKLRGDDTLPFALPAPTTAADWPALGTGAASAATWIHRLYRHSQWVKETMTLKRSPVVLRDPCYMYFGGTSSGSNVVRIRIATNWNTNLPMLLSLWYYDARSPYDEATIGEVRFDFNWSNGTAGFPDQWLYCRATKVSGYRTPFDKIHFRKINGYEVEILLEDSVRPTKNWIYHWFNISEIVTTFAVDEVTIDLIPTPVVTPNSYNKTITI